MKTAKYARMPFYVDAVRLTEENLDEVQEWCRGDRRQEGDDFYLKVKVHRPLNDEQTKAHFGDWILRAPTGFKVYTNKAFRKSFYKVMTISKDEADRLGIEPPHEPRPKGKMPNPSVMAKKNG